jgi:hypothetical protein
MPAGAEGQLQFLGRFDRMLEHEPLGTAALPRRASV